MIDLQLDPFWPAHEADLARVGEALDPDAGVGTDRLRVVGGWRVLSPIDPWFPTMQEQGKGRWARGANRVSGLLEGDAEPSQREVDGLRRHCGGPFLSAAHQHWRALAISVGGVRSSTGRVVGTLVPTVALLTDQDVVVLVRRSAGADADAMRRMGDVRIGAVPAGEISPVRDVWLPLAATGRDLIAAAIGMKRPDGLIVQSTVPLTGSRVAPLSAVAPVDHLRWRFADGSWMDVQLPQPVAAARQEVLRRIEAAGVPVDPEEPFLLAP